MQMVSWGDHLHEMSNLIFLENKKNISNLSSEFVHYMQSVNCWIQIAVHGILK